jgi:transcriptional regulator with XRE-family HTH domain
MQISGDRDLALVASDCSLPSRGEASPILASFLPPPLSCAMPEKDDCDSSPEEDVPFRRALGLRIRAARDAIQMKQEIAAHRIGVATSTFSRWEQGHFAPNLRKLCDLAQVLGVSLDSLCGVERHPIERGAILNKAALRELELAAEQCAALSTLKHLLQPPTVGVAFLLPSDMQLVPPDQVHQVVAHVTSLVARLGPS